MTHHPIHQTSFCKNLITWKIKMGSHLVENPSISQTLSQSPCTALTAGNLPAVRAVKGDCQCLLINDGNSHHNALNLTHDSVQHQPIRGPVSYPTDSLTGAKLELFNSLRYLTSWPWKRISSLISPRDGIYKQTRFSIVVGHSTWAGIIS